MDKVRPNLLERKLYHEEIRAWNVGLQNEINYFVVTNSEKFQADFITLMTEKDKLASEGVTHRGTRDSLVEVKIKKSQVSHQTQVVLEAMNSRNNKIASEVLTADAKNRIELIKIPISATMFTKYTPFEDSQSPILIFRASPGREMHTGWGRLTQPDLYFLTEKGRRPSPGEPSLTPIRHLFIEGVDVNKLTTARKMLLPGTNESVLALQALRSALEEALAINSEFYFIKRGEEIQSPEKRRGYLGFNRKLGLISQSDFMQARFVMNLANSAIHHDYMDIQGITARIALNWVLEFVGKTVGYHWLTKFRAHGTIKHPLWELTTDQTEYRTRRAILDQLQVATEYRAKGQHVNDILYFEETVEEIRETTRDKRDSFEGLNIVEKINTRKTRQSSKEEVMNACFSVAEKMRAKVPTFTHSEIEFFDIIDRYRVEREPEVITSQPVPIYTAQDAIRACMFLYSMLKSSKEIETGNLEKRMTPFDKLDSQMTLVIRKRGTGSTRHKKYGLDSIYRELPEQTNLISRIARASSYDFLTPPEMLQEMR